MNENKIPKHPTTKGMLKIFLDYFKNILPCLAIAKANLE
jgi:hypothetical protein